MSDPKERLIRIMGTFDLATGHADTLDELLDSLESELRDVLGHYREALKQHLTQEPVAMLERDPAIGRLRVTYEDCITELETGTYPLYVQPQGWRDNVAQAYLKGYDEGRPEWVSLTDEDIWDVGSRLSLSKDGIIKFVRAIEANLKDKNT